MKALVTGSSGFIGSTLIEELNTLGFDVYALMRKTSNPTNLEGLRYQRVEGDLDDLESLKRAVRGMNYVFHLAGAIRAPNRAAFLESNSEGTRRLAEAVAEICPGLTRFVFVSSIAAAGPAKSLSPRIETEPDRPVSAYGESKLKGEHALLRFRSAFPISIVRPPIVYGPRDKEVFLFIQSVSRNFAPMMPSSAPDGKKYYSAIHARDLCRGLVQAALAPREKVPSGEIFYLTGDGIFSYDDLMEIIAERLNREPLRIRVPKVAVVAAAAAMTAAGKLTRRTFALNLDKLNELLPDYWICSNEKAKRVLGFAPEFDLPSGIANAIDWYKRQKWI